ncbi:MULTISPECIES: PadR family transcriptional regulator [unclassified Nocardiopsis]|uniref:PadR family transcriptional regulator n=1 Tax=unclassified Nocardiopsis TaxID=2649073 RepID=UPI00135CB38D|nr:MULTISPECIES: PadR family transcriptional regulator [unclassified Nocardiopsis]
MTAMALPGPWSWNARGPRRGRPFPGRGAERAGFGPHDPRVPPAVPPWAGGGFGPGHPFGGFGPGPGGGRGGGRRGGGQRARRGDVRTGILLLLAEEPRSGYEIIREGRERSGGMWRPSPGSVYPMLQQLEDEGLVTQEPGEGRRRPYRLTEEGVAHLEERGADLTPPWEAGAEAYADSRSRYEEVGALAYQVGAAAAQVAQAGSADQLERAKRLLAETRRGLYLILAEEGRDPAARDGDDGDSDL